MKKIDWAHEFEYKMSIFPMAQSLMVLSSFIMFIKNPSLLAALWFIFSVYLFPLLTSRLVNIFFPTREGRYRIGRKGVEGWVLQLKIQIFLTTFPYFERALHMVPGLYSVWLRAWGSKIGKRVIWTPHVEVIDRNLIEVGDDVIFGHKTVLTSHVIFRIKDEHLVYAKKVKVGKGVIVGGDSILGPGMVVEDYVQVPALTQIIKIKKDNNGVLN